MGIWDLCPSTLLNKALRMALKEFLQHSKESRGVLEHMGTHGGFNGKERKEVSQERKEGFQGKGGRKLPRYVRKEGSKGREEGRLWRKS